MIPPEVRYGWRKPVCVKEKLTRFVHVAYAKILMAVGPVVDLMPEGIRKAYIDRIGYMADVVLGES